MTLSPKTYSQSINWKTTGNENITGNHFIGTTDASDLIFRSNNLERLRITAEGFSIFNDSVHIRGPLFLGDSTLLIEENRITGYGTTDRLSTDGVAINFLKRKMDTVLGQRVYYSDIRFGLGLEQPFYQMHLHQETHPDFYPDLIPTTIGFTNENTGAGAENGLSLGIDLDGTAFITQQEDRNLFFYTGSMSGSENALRMSIIGESGDNLGFVGIGTAEPESELDVAGSVHIRDILGIGTNDTLTDLIHDATKSLIYGNKKLPIEPIPACNYYWLNLQPPTMYNNGGITFATSPCYDNGNFDNSAHERMRITPEGFVGIGTTCPDQKLTVNGIIKARQEVIVEEVGGWCDFVLEPDYKLQPFLERMDIIKSQRHLPNILPESEILENGVPVTKTLKGLLQNVEEMYLYLELLENRLNEIEEENSRLRLELSNR